MAGRGPSKGGKRGGNSAPARRGEPAAGRRNIDSVAIARLVGVSRSTVSKALNDYPYVAAATRERILQAVRTYGYYPNHSAQILAGKRTNTLGLYFFSSGHFSEDVLADFMLSSVIEIAAVLGYHTLAYVIRDREDDATRRALTEAFYQRRIAAGVFIGARNREPLIERLVADGYVVGVFDQRPPRRPEGNRVVANFDDIITARAVIDYLASQGHTRIGIINGDRLRNAGAMRYRGFLDGMRAHGLAMRERWMMDGDFQKEGGYRAMRGLLAAEKRLPTAIATVNDNTAFGAMRAIDEYGLRIPDDISIVGVDGHPFCAYARPPLTTFEYDILAMMRGLISAVIAIVEARQDRVDRCQVFSSHLVERESCRRIEAR